MMLPPGISGKTVSCPLPKMPTISTSLSEPLTTDFSGEPSPGSKSDTGTLVLGMTPGEKADET